MKRILIYLIATVCVSCFQTQAAIKFKPETLRTTSTQSHKDVVDAVGQLISQDITAMHITWPEAANDNVAAIEVVFYGLPPEELDKIQFSTTPGDIIRVDRQTKSGVSATLFVPLNASSVSLTHPEFGEDKMEIDRIMMPKTLYRVEAELEALHNVVINAAADPGVPVLVTFGKYGQKNSPATFENIPNGKYPLTIGAGTSQRTDTVTVDVEHTYFDFKGNPTLDLRHKSNVALKTKGEKNTKFYVDEEYVGVGEEVSAVLTYGPHVIRAEINKDKYDERPVTVDAKTQQIFLAPQARKTLEFVGLYNGHPVSTQLLVPRGLSSGFKASHQMRLLADNQQLTVELADDAGHKGKKSIKITENMPVDHQVKLQSGRAMVWPWESDYKTAKWGWEVSYVTKQISISGYADEDSEKFSTAWNGVWDDGFNHWLHGFRTGFHFQPAFKFGLGMYTGLFVEFYFSHNSEGIEEYKDYVEIDMSIPLHILYQFPLGRKVAVGFHTGPSFNWSLSGVYSNGLFKDEAESDTYKVDFGEEPYPKSFSCNWDFALWLRLGPVYLSGTVSKGMNDLGCFPDFGRESKSSMKKYILGVSFVF